MTDQVQEVPQAPPIPDEQPPLIGDSNRPSLAPAPIPAPEPQANGTEPDKVAVTTEINEAACVVWSKLYSNKSGAEVTLTVRGMDSRKTIDDFFGAAMYAMEKYDLSSQPPRTSQRPASGNTPVTSGNIVPGGNQPPSPGGSQPPVPGGVQNGEKQSGEITAERMDIVYQGDKIILQFYEQGHKYPDIKRYCRSEGEAVDVLNGAADWDWTGRVQPGEYNLAFKINWTQGKPANNKYGFYRDITKLTLLQ